MELNQYATAQKDRHGANLFGLYELVYSGHNVNTFSMCVAEKALIVAQISKCTRV